jgi:hypothetical protein
MCRQRAKQRFHIDAEQRSDAGAALIRLGRTTKAAKSGGLEMSLTVDSKGGSEGRLEGHAMRAPAPLRLVRPAVR